MSIDEIKKGLTSLSEAKQREVSAFLFHLRHAHDSDYQDRISRRLGDSSDANWIRLEEFEKRLEAK